MAGEKYLFFARRYISEKSAWGRGYKLPSKLAAQVWETTHEKPSLGGARIFVYLTLLVTSALKEREGSRLPWVVRALRLAFLTENSPVMYSRADLWWW